MVAHTSAREGQREKEGGREKLGKGEERRAPVCANDLQRRLSCRSSLRQALRQRVLASAEARSDRVLDLRRNSTRPIRATSPSNSRSALARFLVGLPLDPFPCCTHQLSFTFPRNGGMGTPDPRPSFWPRVRTCVLSSHAPYLPLALRSCVPALLLSEM